MSSFWQERKNPFFILAPMEDVTDTVFREVIMSVSNPEVLNVLFTEFMSTDGYLNERGHKSVSERLIISESERKLLRKNNIKLVAQIWGNNPDKFYKTAEKICESGDFDGIDINMGCPVKKVVKKGTCSALIKEPQLAAEIIQATKSGSQLPVSVKTRIGFNSVITEEWTGHLLEQNIAALTIHGRTQKMQSDGLADWDEISNAAKVRKEMQKDTAIIGNGDLESYEQGLRKIENYELEGVMVGRGIFKNPWMFNKESFNPTFNQRIDLLEKHVNLFNTTWGKNKNFNILKRFFKIYINSHPGAAEFRTRLMDARDYSELFQTISRLNSIVLSP